MNNPELKKLKSKKNLVLGDVAMALLDKDFNNKITESEINDLIQKSVEISVLLGIKELCKTCKKKLSRGDGYNEEPTLNQENRYNESGRNQLNDSLPTLLTPPTKISVSEIKEIEFKL